MNGPCARTRRGRPWSKPWLSLLALLLLAHVLPAAAQAVDPLPFQDQQQELRFQRLTAQLRCLVCQNENLADSNATLARDLRHQVFAQLQAGRSDAQIKQYMVDRYSQFVLYDPPLAPGTWLLWFGPLLFLLGGAAMVVATLRRRAAAAQVPAQQEPEELW
ncbi:cytochrome c-type biogenesis protein [Xanthomonas translucens]|uniref:Cytochrome c-type biogenesis protein n=3 Tax=Xanthomonas campestris pv. translucens TaxID=343 RepID=A0A109HKZ5_XANCT|nr:cytochrome c-type biogenesis protein [Xanthomonas translucens]KTF40041.1 cytochrome C biogenesis protein [Xanthomonas translucens pv. translucens]KWV14050.1 cytochrome C biogenesis protein [Xanthomonas translucens]KWV14333.1 cytochrome C biogenesis protein [Xanthomonas translucens]MCC8448036.1 cytochrome c-type biogenesis protein CcmH [Xanthomonas translucens pv. translucens]MCS3360265.1 cytochrome c-type biogenesis protein CcmH [Xanthomonas translucens pv. translucens]